jgi:hypothetical protein
MRGLIRGKREWPQSATGVWQQYAAYFLRGRFGAAGCRFGGTQPRRGPRGAMFLSTIFPSVSFHFCIPDDQLGHFGFRASFLVAPPPRFSRVVQLVDW